MEKTPTSSSLESSPQPQTSKGRRFEILQRSFNYGGANSRWLAVKPAQTELKQAETHDLKSLTETIPEILKVISRELARLAYPRHDDRTATTTEQTFAMTFCFEVPEQGVFVAQGKFEENLSHNLRTGTNSGIRLLIFPDLQDAKDFIDSYSELEECDSSLASQELAITVRRNVSLKRFTFINKTSGTKVELNEKTGQAELDQTAMQVWHEIAKALKSANIDLYSAAASTTNSEAN